MAARKSTRVDELREVGREAFLARFPVFSDSPPWTQTWTLETNTTKEAALIDAIAAMLAHADVQRRRKPEAEPAAPLPFSPNALYAELRKRVPDKVILEPVEHRLFGMLGGKLKGISGLDSSDLERVVSWIDAGGLAHWTTQPTFAHVVQNIGKFIAYAREWAARGRQPIRKGGSNVGSTTSDATETTLSEDFR